MRFNILLLLLAVVALFAVANAQTDCGPPQCYFPCTNAKPAVDFVFLIDVSGSMANPISGVKTGLTQFVDTLSTNITAYFSLAYFGGSNSGGTPKNSNYGGAATLVLNHVSSASSFITSMGNMVSIASNTLSPYAGGVEPGLESILSALQAAKTDNMGINFITGYNTKKVFIIVTNEDSDPPVFSANLFSTSTGHETGGGTVNHVDYQNGHCLNDGLTYTKCGYSLSTLGTGTWTSTSPETTGEWTAYQAEINAAAAALISNQASVYMFVAGSKSISQTTQCTADVAGAQSCLTRYQYCDPDSQHQNTDYSGFDAAATLTLIKNAGLSGNLQGQLLTAGLQMRCFDVYATGSSSYVDNFFSQIVADLSACQTTCYDYVCTSPTTCAPPVNMCGCDGVKNSGKVADGYGGCCWANKTDCSGRCANTYSYDSCGVCTLGGALDSYCKQDCNNNYYLTGVPTGYNYTIPSTFDAAGYLLMNSDLVTAYENTWKNVAAIAQHFHDYGMFESRSYCTFDDSYFNSANSMNLGQTQAEAAWLASLLTSKKLLAQCVAGSQRRYPPLPKDSCNQCIIDAASPPYCVQDCGGVWRTAATASQASFYDNCGYCVAAGTDPNAHKDSCGVCDGNNASMNQCNNCTGTHAVDSCGQPVCKGLTCDIDCDGVARNPLTHHLNDCGTCVLNGVTDSGSSPACLQDCAGTWYNVSTTGNPPPPHHIDECKNCVPAGVTRLPTCVQDCSGNWTGNAYYDKCGQCVVNGKTTYSCLQDCNGTYYTSNHNAPDSLDDCGICRPVGSSSWDSTKDVCGVCSNTPGYNTTVLCIQDCKGVYNLSTSTNRAFTDICGVCWFANQSAQANSEMDLCGRCPGDTGYNTGSGIADTQGAICPCGATPKNCTPSASVTTCGDSCPYFCPGTNGVLPNSCGFCPTDAGYGGPNGNKDSCGVCCNSTAVNSTCNTEIDSCGVCFGFDTWKNNPCKICDQYYGTSHALCKPDCDGQYNSTKKIGCDGICGSNAVCAVCGDGKIEAGEDCDLGSKNGKSLNTPGSGCNDCKAETGALGAAIGGAIGGVAAIVALALAAFFAFRYAQKNGLIGNANKQVDFGASNTNPLYKSEVAVHQNPLYETS